MDKRELEERAIHFSNEAIKHDPQSNVDKLYIPLTYRERAISNYRLAIESYEKLIHLHISKDLNSFYKHSIENYQKRIQILEKMN